MPCEHFRCPIRVIPAIVPEQLSHRLILSVEESLRAIARNGFMKLVRNYPEKYLVVVCVVPSLSIIGLVIAKTASWTKKRQRRYKEKPFFRLFSLLV